MSDVTHDGIGVRGLTSANAVYVGDFGRNPAAIGYSTVQYYNNREVGAKHGDTPAQNLGEKNGVFTYKWLGLFPNERL